ncbi:MAG: exodeoxyribonuclease VII small subunit [Chloroflexi bacterium]|nr:exodeoxyribonuclease VII small subunit [Chloroflexota bacterium]
MSRTTVLKAVQELDYEAAFLELEKVVAALESEQNPLEESLALFERGQALARRCGELLEKAELKVRQLSGDSLQDFEEA